MESLRKLEKTVAKWYENVPHLPIGGRVWLSESAWWLVVIALILSAIGAFWVVAGLIIASIGLAVAGSAAVVAPVYGGATVAALSGVLIISVLTVLAFMVIDIVLMALAISPLKSHQKRGWDLLFVLALLNALSVVISGLLSFNIFSIIWGLIWTAVGAYFLFEIRSYFGGEKKHVKTAKKKA